MLKTRLPIFGTNTPSLTDFGEIVFGAPNEAKLSSLSIGEVDFVDAVAGRPVVETVGIAFRVW